MARFSSLITEELAKASDLHEAEERFDMQKEMDLLQSRASIILGILIASKEFYQTFTYSTSEDLHVFSNSSKRIIVVDVLTKCALDQVPNIDSYKFAAHPLFEKKISTYTGSTDKPNLQLSKNRPWDVALSVILKVEALDTAMSLQPESYLLFREYSILKHAWECYVREHMDFDEMTGIPIVFDYLEVPNTIYNYEEREECKVVDIYGCLVPWKSDTRSTMAYMSMEKMGPSIMFLQQLMVHTKRRTRTFDLETSFKIFDQLICRCLQLHRFCIVHNAVEPKNIYFGRASCFNVVYLGNYARSLVMDMRDRKMADIFLGGNARYTSQYRARGTNPSPMQDIESAFYTLLSMVVSNLPWDIYLVKNESSPRESDETPVNQSNQDGLEGLDSHPKVRELKSSFWKSTSGINRVLADVRYLSVGSDANHVNLATEIIRDVYSRLRDQFQLVGSKPKTSIVGNLVSSQSTEYQFYVELRRAILLFFRFESLSVSLSTPTYQKKIEAVARDELEPRPAWNISNWCFNVVQMNAPGNMRLSMVPVSVVARTNN